MLTLIVTGWVIYPKLTLAEVGYLVIAGRAMCDTGVGSGHVSHRGSAAQTIAVAQPTAGLAVLVAAQTPSVMLIEPDGTSIYALLEILEIE